MRAVLSRIRLGRAHSLPLPPQRVKLPQDTKCLQFQTTALCYETALPLNGTVGLVRQLSPLVTSARRAWYSTGGKEQSGGDPKDGARRSTSPAEKRDELRSDLLIEEQQSDVTAEKLQTARNEAIASAVKNMPPSRLPSEKSGTTSHEDPDAPYQKPIKNKIVDTSLPSDAVKNRSAIVGRFNDTLDSFLNFLAVASQRLNAYTGTDYSGISALRSSISEQEELVNERHIELGTTRETLTQAINSQAASQKEVVQLLERKSSWSSTDLERYMSLVRSEHVNEQAVQAAKEAVAETERELEEARMNLEKSERKQYHEEQLWSDTIRRNSTWVTFGLMGVNIFLLFVGLVVVEPWRRKRIVTEIKDALDAKSPAMGGGISRLPGIEAEIDAATPPSGRSLEEIEDELPIPIPAQEPRVSATSSGEAPAAMLTDTSGSPAQPPTFKLYANSWSYTFALWRECWADLFSQRRVVLCRVDLTTAALEGAAAGAACMGLLFVLLRPR